MPETQTQIERLQSAGLVDSDGFLTAAGNFEATLSKYEPNLEAGEAGRYRDYFDRGLIAEDFSRTEDGKIYFMSHEEVLHAGVEAHQKWRELGAWEEWHDQNAPRDEEGVKLPFHKVVGMGVKALATETLPEAAAGFALGARAAAPEGIPKLLDWIGGSPLAPVLNAILPGTQAAYKLGRARELAGVSSEELEKWYDNAALASVGKGVSEMHRNSVWLAKGLELQSAWIQKETFGTPGDEDHYGRKLFEFENAMSEFDDQDAIDGMATGQAFLQLMGELAGHELSEEEKYAQITQARAKVEKARESFSKKELEGLDKNMASAGQFVEASTPLTTFASLGLRLGATTTKQVLNLNKQIASHTTKIAVMRRMVDKGALATRHVKKGETIIPTGHLKQRLASLTDELADMKGQLGKLEANTGLTGTFKDATRGAARKTTEALSKTGRALAQTRLGIWGLDKIDPLMDAAKAGISTANKFRGFAVVAGPLGGFAAGGPLVAGAALLATLPRRYNILRAAFMTMSDMGSEFLRRKGTVPYWQRVAEASSSNVWARSGAIGMDLLRYPARLASRTAEAGAKGIIAEVPFSMAGSLHLGPEVWAADAMSEGLLFSSPGMVRGMVHGLGGMPAVAKRAEFDKMALADAAEVRRNLTSDNQRTAFDRLGKEHRREVGVYGATFPDIRWKFDPDATESSWNKQTKEMTIATSSPDPMSALIGHEVAHQIHDRGLTQLVIDELVGPDGALRMTKEQYLLSQAKRNKRGEIIIQSEAELQAERDRARTDESGDVVLPDDPGEAGIDILPDLLPLNEIGQEVKRKYEARKGETIGDDELAIEYYADSVGAALSGNRIKLQELARRHPLVRRLIDGTLNKFAFGREFLLRNGVLFDQYGNPTAGQGVMGAILQSPTLARATETYLRENAGRSIESVSEKAVERAIAQADPLTPEDEDRAIREDIVNYAFDDDGNVKFLPNGRPEGIDDETWKGKQNAGLTIIQELAERYGVEPVTLGTGEKAYRLSRTQWDEVLRLLHESGWYNPRQIKIFQDMIDAVVSGEGDSWNLHYHGNYKTDKVGRKRVPKQGRFAKSKLGVPYDITVSSKGNILFRMIDMDRLQNNAEKAFNTKLGKSLYKNTAEIMRDLETLAKNHRDGKPNLTHFRDQDKVDFLNAIMGVINKDHKKKNPLFAKPVFKNFQNKYTAIFSTRLDRINRARKANTKALPFRLEDWKKNLMPGPVSSLKENEVLLGLYDDGEMMTRRGPTGLVHAQAFGSHSTRNGIRWFVKGSELIIYEKVTPRERDLIREEADYRLGPQGVTRVKGLGVDPTATKLQTVDALDSELRRMPAKPEWVGPPTFFDPAEPVVSVENQPGFNSGVLRGLHTATKSVQRAFFQEIEEALAHAKSGDVIAHEMGLAGLLGPEGLKRTEPAPSVWINATGKIEINQASQVGGFISREAAELYALVRGYYTYQEAVAGYSPVDGGDMTGAEFYLGRGLKTKGEVTGVMRTIKKALRDAGIKQRKAAEDFAFYPTPEGFNLVHLGFNEAITPDIRNGVFDEVTEYVDLDEAVLFDTETFYESNNWTTEDIIQKDGTVIKAAPGGEYFRQAIKAKASSLGRPNLLAGVDRRVGSSLQGVYEKYSEALGLGESGRQPARRFKDQGALKGEEHGPEAIPVRYKTHRTGEVVLDEDGKPKPIEVPYKLTEGPFVDEPHPAPRDPTIDYLEDGNRHYELTGPNKDKLRELAENGSVDAAADLVVEEATRALDIPEIAAGLGWYSRMREKLGGSLGFAFDIFTQFLGATSAKTPVETNFSQSMDVIEQYKSGKFEETIPAYLALRSAMKEGLEATRELLRKEGIKPKGKTLSKLADDYIEAKNLMPRQHNGERFNSNGGAVLRVVAGVWFQEVAAPKTPQFAMNLFGTSLRATIDVWAARTLRKIFHRGTDRWRIQPESETGVSNLDFALGQMVFARAAERMGMSPDDLQALMWFAEKDVWARNGWTGEIGSFKGSFDAAAEVYFPAGGEPRRLDYSRNIMTYLQKRRLVEHDDTLPPPSTKKEVDLLKTHEKQLREAAAQPGVQEWLVEAGTKEIH